MASKRYEDKKIAQDEVRVTPPRYDAEDMKQALATLQAGGLILYPTDTIWGIGCDATNAEAVRKVFALKKRDDAKALISIYHTPTILPTLMTKVPAVAYDLIDAAPRPLTIIYPDVKGLAENLLAEDGTAGIRIVDEYFCNELCRRFRKPIVSTSANISGEPSPANFRAVSDEIKNGVDYVVKYRQKESAKHTASNIIKLDADGAFKVLR